MKKALILVLTNFFILTLILLGKPAKAQTTTITGQFLYGLQLYVLPEKQTPPDYATAIYSSTIDENDFITSGLYENWLQPRLPDGINGYIYLVDSTHTIKNVYLGGGYLEQGQTLSYPYEPSIEMKHYNAPLITLFILNPVNKGYFETPTLDYIVYHENNDGSTPRIRLIDATTNENDYNRVKLAINGYDTGYNAGYSIGYNNGQVNGYDSGYQDGQNNGYSAGYNAGQYDFYNEYYDEIYNRGYNAGLGDRQLGVNTVVIFNQQVNDNNDSATLGGGVNYQRTAQHIIANGSFNYQNLPKQRSFVSYRSYYGHKYLLYLSKSLLDSHIQINDYNNTGNQYVVARTEQSYIFTSQNSTNVDTLVSIYYTPKDQSTFINDDFYVCLYDLSNIYGLGNEPSTLEDFKEDFPSLYYPYTNQQMISIDYENGYKNGYDDAYPLGYDDGKSYQATQQLTSDGWIKNIFTGIGSFLALEILPGVSIGLIVGIPFIITVAWFVLKMARGGSSE